MFLSFKLFKLKIGVVKVLGGAACTTAAGTGTCAGASTGMCTCAGAVSAGTVYTGAARTRYGHVCYVYANIGVGRIAVSK